MNWQFINLALISGSVAIKSVAISWYLCKTNISQSNWPEIPPHDHFKMACIISSSIFIAIFSYVLYIGLFCEHHYRNNHSKNMDCTFLLGLHLSWVHTEERVGVFTLSARSQIMDCSSFLVYVSVHCNEDEKERRSERFCYVKSRGFIKSINKKQKFPIFQLLWSLRGFLFKTDWLKIIFDL